MRGERGLVCIDGTAVADGRKMFVVRYLQARDPDLAGTPFFATWSADAAWLSDLRPALGTRIPRRLRYCGDGMTGQPAGFTAGTVASTALPFGQMAPARSQVSQRDTGHPFSGRSAPGLLN